MAHCDRWESLIAMGNHGSIYADKLSGNKNVHLLIVGKFGMHGDLIAICDVTRCCLYTGGALITKMLAIQKMK